MPNSLQYPLERQRDVQRKWGRLLRRTAASSGNVSSLGPCPVAVLVDTMPPRDLNDDDDTDDDEEDDEAEEDREPAVIREPDKEGAMRQDARVSELQLT
jgi:hypothetical protein